MARTVGNGLKIPAGAGTGYVATADSLGNLAWQAANPDGVAQAGVLLAADCALTINSITQVTIAAGTCYTLQSGLPTRATPGSTVLSGIVASGAGTQRLDQVVCSSAGVVSMLTGTQNAATTLANRTGAAAIPAGSQLLHDVMVTTGGVLAANVRDRRPWARGGSVIWQDAGPRTIAVASGALAISGRRLEVGPASWVQIILTASVTPPAVANARIDIQPLYDASAFDRSVRLRPVTASIDNGFTIAWSSAASSGSHFITFNGQSQDGAATISSMTITAIEHVRPNQSNGTT